MQPRLHGIPLRIVGLVALLILALAVGGLLLIGSQPKLPAPFGLAVNGQVAYANGGDIYTVNPAAGTAAAVVTGAETDLGPVWSRDGSSLAFERKLSGPSGPGRLYVARSDGGGLVAVTGLVADLYSYAFSPDGREVMYLLGNQSEL